jgi:RNA polymerase-associated protein RTF1
MDMEISDDESEDGQISKYEQEEEKDRKLFKKAPSPVDEPVTMAELENCRLTRDMLAKHCMAPWFQDYVQSALLVRSFIFSLHLGYSGMGAVPYWIRGWPTRISDMRDLECVLATLFMVRMAVKLLKDLGADFVKPYKINDKTVNQALELRHGKSVRLFNMDKVSNSAFLPVCISYLSWQSPTLTVPAERI